MIISSVTTARSGGEEAHPRVARSRSRNLRAGLAVLALFALIAAITSASARAAGSPAATSASHRFNARTVARLTRALQSSSASTWAPGVIAGVWVGNRRWTSVQGSTQRAAGPRPILGDHTRIGSVTKTMVGTLILQLVDQGKLRLDETIEPWFPSLPDAGKITIRELGDMSSGIVSYTADPAITDRYFAHPMLAWNPDTLIAGGAALPRKFDPGNGFDYSDTNFVMLGRIVEMVTHQPLAQVMRAKLFKPLGMRDSSYPTTNRIPGPFWRGYTIQGSVFGNALDGTNWTPSFAAGAGGAISTLADLRVWGRAVGTGALLKPATQRARLIPNPASTVGGRAYLFALGSDHGWLGHAGSIPGYNTEVQYLPSLRATIVVLTNTDISDADRLTSATAVYHALARVISPGHVPTG